MRAVIAFFIREHFVWLCKLVVLDSAGYVSSNVIITGTGNCEHRRYKVRVIAKE